MSEKLDRLLELSGLLASSYFNRDERQKEYDELYKELKGNLG